jgi:hypothetical protein
MVDMQRTAVCLQTGWVVSSEATITRPGSSASVEATGNGMAWSRNSAISVAGSPDTWTLRRKGRDASHREGSSELESGARSEWNIKRATAVVTQYGC